MLHTNFSLLSRLPFFDILPELTTNAKCDMLQELDKTEHTSEEDIAPNEGERTVLSSDNDGMRSPSLDFLDTSADNVTEDMILDYLARIISSMYLKAHGVNENKTGSDILPGFNKRTG